MNKRLLIGLLALATALSCTRTYDVIVIGGGAGGTMAAIEAARDSALTLVVEETPWLGGMLTSAGVSAIDGNYRLRGGLFGEFTDSLAQRYGGYEALQSGWVSNILFNPAVGAEVLHNMVADAGVHIRCRNKVTRIKKRWASGWTITLESGIRYHARVLIDGTELGDVAKAVGCAELRDRISAQDFTYVAIVKFYDHEVPMEQPEGYDRDFYRNCCNNPLSCNKDGLNPFGQRLWSPEMMLSYGRLPDGHIMLNWPICGNDYFAEYLDMTPVQRDSVVREAKLRTLGYPEEAGLIARHHDPESDSLDDAALLYLADKFIQGDHEVTIDERFAASRQRCMTVEAIQAHERRYQAAKRIEEMLNRS